MRSSSLSVEKSTSSQPSEKPVFSCDAVFSVFASAAFAMSAPGKTEVSNTAVKQNPKIRLPMWCI